MASKWFRTVSCYEYVVAVYKNLTKEEANADFWLQDQTKPKVVKIVLFECIEEYASQIVDMNQGCKVMFDERKPDELKLMYEVFLRVDHTLTHIIKRMEPFIIAEGEKIVLNAELQKQPLNLVQKLLALKNEVDDLIAGSFQNDMRFQKARDQSF